MRGWQAPNILLHVLVLAVNIRLVMRTWFDLTLQLSSQPFRSLNITFNFTPSTRPLSFMRILGRDCNVHWRQAAVAKYLFICCALLLKKRNQKKMPAFLKDKLAERSYATFTARCKFAKLFRDLIHNKFSHQDKQCLW